MNRRQFLLSGSAVALATMLPVPVLAAIPAYPTYDGVQIAKLGLIEDALNVGEVYGFDLAERVWQFGWAPSSASTVEQLRELTQEYVLEWGAVDHYNRLRFLVAITQELERLFPNDVDAQIRRLHQHAWSGRPPFNEGGRTVRELMNGNYFELWHAALALGSDVDSHGLAEMDNFG